MLKKIKSIKIIKDIFKPLDNKRKLNLIKYNNNLQKSNNIAIIFYQIYSPTYIIYGVNGIGKEYNTENDNIVFEGEFKNGKRNGKGKEYEYGKILFERI